jgi:hypothetical protein
MPAGGCAPEPPRGSREPMRVFAADIAVRPVGSGLESSPGSRRRPALSQTGAAGFLGCAPRQRHRGSSAGLPCVLPDFAARLLGWAPVRDAAAGRQAHRPFREPFSARLVGRAPGPEEAQGPVLLPCILRRHRDRAPHLRPRPGGIARPKKVAPLPPERRGWAGPECPGQKHCGFAWRPHGFTGERCREPGKRRLGVVRPRRALVLSRTVLSFGLPLRLMASCGRVVSLSRAGGWSPAAWGGRMAGQPASGEACRGVDVPEPG